MYTTLTKIMGDTMGKVIFQKISQEVPPSIFRLIHGHGNGLESGDKQQRLDAGFPQQGKDTVHKPGDKAHQIFRPLHPGKEHSQHLTVE